MILLSGVSRPVLVDGGSGWSRSGSIALSSFFSISIQTHASNDVSGVGERGLRYCVVSTGATVACAAAASPLHDPFDHGDFRVAYFTLFNCAKKIPDLLSRHQSCIFQRVQLRP